MVRVRIAAESRRYREGLAAMLGQESGIDVVGSAADGDDAARALRTVATDVLLLELPSRENAWAVRALVPAVEAAARGEVLCSHQ